MRVIALHHSKGGVGKTAAAVNLAYQAARDGARVLLWDLDAQGAASFYLGIDAPGQGKTRKLVKGDLEARIVATDHPGLDLLPAEFGYRHLDRLLDADKKPERHLRKRLKPLRDDYDLAFLDCPPSLSRVSESVFHAADLLLTPVIPTTLSLRTLEQLAAVIDDQPASLRPFLSMLDRRRRLQRDLQQRLQTDWPGLLATAVPYASEVERMGLERAPVAAFAPRSRAARAFAELWRELQPQL